MNNMLGFFKNRSCRLTRVAALALVLAGAVGLWQAVPVSKVEASAPVDLDVGATTPPASFAGVIDAVKPAVVNISISKTLGQPFTGQAPPESPFPPGSPFEDFLRRFFERQSHTQYQGEAPVVRGMGSGFIVDPEGFVVTNNHVVQGADTINVTLDDGTQYTAELLGTDPKTDLALLKIDANSPLPFARFGDSDSTRVGDWVIAIGNPFGLGGTATTGIVSARGRDIQSGPFDDFLQIDAPINSGNSGGPLFDTKGRVIGINTAIFTPNGGNVGIGFAIPSRQAEPVLQQIRTLGRVERGWIGVQIQAVDPSIGAAFGLDEARGALVADVVSESPAERAGLEPGDVILRFNDEDIEHVKDLSRAVAELPPGAKAVVEVWRNGEHRSLNLVLGESPESTVRAKQRAPASASQSTGRLGISLAPLTSDSRARYGVDDDVEGALIVAVETDSPAAERGLRPGDVILRIGQESVDGPSKAADAIQAASGQQHPTVVLRIARGGSRFFVAVPFA